MRLIATDISDMIPPIFARVVEKDIWVLGICADYLEDNGIDGSILRIIAENHFLLDDSGFCYCHIISNGFGYSWSNGGTSNGSGNGSGYYCTSIHGNGNGNGNGNYSSINGNGFGRGYGSNVGNGFSNGGHCLWL